VTWITLCGWNTSTLTQGDNLSLSRRVMLVASAKLRFEPHNPRVRIVRHRIHPGPTALLRAGARIARHEDGRL
jgi:hypothetical protein